MPLVMLESHETMKVFVLETTWVFSVRDVSMEAHFMFSPSLYPLRYG